MLTCLLTCAVYAEQPMPLAGAMSDKLLRALQAEEFHGLPEVLVTDVKVLTEQLNHIIATQTGELGTAAWVIRSNAVIALGLHCGDKAVDSLSRLAAEKGEPFRRDAIIGLGRTKSNEAVKKIIPFFESENESFREAAIDGLALAGTQQALDALKTFDPSKDKEFIRRKHRAAVEKLTAAIKSADKK
jgi:HEAT repeat protein